MLENNLDVLRRAITIDYKSTKKRIGYCVLMLINTLILTGQTVNIIQSLGDIIKTTSGLAIYALKLQVTYKTCFLFGQKDRITSMHRTLKKYFWDTDAAGEIVKKRADKWFEIVNFGLAMHSCLVMSIYLWFCFFPLTSFPPGVRTLPIQISLPFDANPSPLHEFVYVFLCLSGTGNILIILLFDFLFVYFCQHLIVQFELLKAKLENINEHFQNLDDGSVVRSEELQRTFVQRLTVCIDHHALLLEFGRNLKLFSSASIAIQLTMSMLALINLGFGISKTDFGFMCLEMIILFFSLSVEMVLYGIHGSEIEHQSASVAQAIYQSQWYLLSPRFTKHVLLLQMNAQREIRITALGVLDINNMTMVLIFRHIFSAITLLQSIEG